MARKREKYPEVEVGNAVCGDRVQPYMRKSPVYITAPYHGMDEVRIELLAPVYPPTSVRSSSDVWDLFAALEQSFTASPRGLLGWSSRTELFFLDHMLGDAVALEEVALDLEKPFKKRVLLYAQKARVAFEAIRDIYKKHQFVIKYRWVDNPDRMMPIPLDEWEGKWRAWVHPDEGIWDAVRYRARTEIRQKWDRGMSYLWCAMVGMAEAEAFAINKAKVEELEIPAGDPPLEVNPVPVPTPGEVVPDHQVVPVPVVPDVLVPVPLEPGQVTPLPLDPDGGDDDDDEGDPDDIPDDVPDDIPDMLPEDVPARKPARLGMLAVVAVAGFLLLRGR